ncbi:Zinc finger protein 62 [Chionoecetes opilio]|uniref:Zinc finger protein 62 n=1 Tax=Chionoecetes opilio TaxID=41210 RepID=A0A8J4YT86_CHIOP|nr:Zinc finger protein 62 [Chionoecetes opilio]
MAHNLQPLVLRNDHYIVPEVVHPGVVARGSSGLPPAPAYTEKRLLPQPFEVRNKKRPKSRTYFVCTVLECKEKFSCAENLETHMKLHQVIKPFACNICGKVCRTESRLAIHQARHATDGEKCKCDICERNFSSRSALKKHKLRIHRPLPHICPYCQSGFEKHQYMLIHAKRAHENESLPEASEDKQSMLKINFESNEFYSQQGADDGKNYFKTNYDANEDENQPSQSAPAPSSPYEYQKEQKVAGCNTNNVEKTAVVSPSITCEMCTSTFPSLSYLKQHVAVHINEKNLTCQHCKMRFTNHQLLSNHLKLHNFEPEPIASFPSNFNNGNFAQYVPLSGQPTVTRGPQVVGKYICALCSEQFLTLGSLKRHQARGHNSVDLKDNSQGHEDRELECVRERSERRMGGLQHARTGINGDSLCGGHPLGGVALRNRHQIRDSISKTN